MYGKKRQLWLLEFYSEKYGNTILFSLQFITIFINWYNVNIPTY